MGNDTGVGEAERCWFAPSWGVLWRSKLVLAAILVVLGVFGSSPAYGFPPYRSTDAETADPWTMEARLGLLRLERDGHRNEYSSPLLRLNTGFPHNLELVSEFEYRADEGEVADVALGFKWIPFMRALSVGMENLALLPVTPERHDPGVESTLLATQRLGALRIHVNGGGFYDPRPGEDEVGWKSGMIVEQQWGRSRVGVEVFAKQVRSEPVQVLAGPGIIFDVGPFDVRVGVHVGLTEAAPDLAPSLWVTGRLPLWPDGSYEGK